MLYVASAPAVGAVKVDPTTMEVSGAARNMHVGTPNPRFSWVFPGPGSQTNWEIDVDDDPNFTPPMWFWESGGGSKGGLEADTNVVFQEVIPPGSSYHPMDTRADLMYWRLRVQSNNDPNWRTAANYTYGVFKQNQLPTPPQGVSAVGDLVAGSIAATVFPPLNPSPREFFVAANGNDNNPGSLAAPFKTIGHGITVLNPGDTLTIRGGTYNESVRVSGSSIKNGEPGNPITIRNRAGETVILRGLAGGPAPASAITFAGSGSSVKHWTVDGLTIGGTGVAVGIYLYFADFITIRNITFESNFGRSCASCYATGIQMAGGGNGNRVLNSKFLTDIFDGIDVLGSRYVEIRGCEFTKSRHTSIQFHNAGSQDSIVSDCVFRDMSPASGPLSYYLSSDGGVARNNLFYNITNPANGYAASIQILRCGKILMENNTFFRTYVGVGVGEHNRFLVMRNNVFLENEVAIDFTQARKSPPGSSSVGTVIDHNFLFNNGKEIDQAYSQDAADMKITNNCSGGPAPSSNLACDPKFVNPAAGDFHLQASSPAKDAGDPNSPVPVGGGATVDVGAFELGAAAKPPYDYQNESNLADVTPRLIWTFVDPDTLLNDYNPVVFPDVDVQGEFQIQIDTKNTFDSVNGSRPLFDSGSVLSAVSTYTVPNLNALPGGDYYVRIRTADENIKLLGAWSDNNVRIRIAAEPQAPMLTQQNPSTGAVGVDPNAIYSTHVVDVGSGVNSNTIVVSTGINDSSAPNVVTPTITQADATGQDFLVSFRPVGSLSSGDVIYVRVRADDRFVPPNSLNAVYSFTLRDVTPPAPPANVRVVP